MPERAAAQRLLASDVRECSLTAVDVLDRARGSVVLVGAGPPTRASVEWAAREARARGQRLVVVGCRALRPAPAPRRSAWAPVRPATAWGRLNPSPTGTDHVLVVGEPAAWLTALAATAACLVLVRARPAEHEADASALDGCITAGGCPVVLLPTREAPARSGVVAGVDGSRAGWEAVRFAAVEATAHGEDLVLVHGHRPPPDGGSTADARWWLTELEVGEQRERLGVLAGHLVREFPDLPVRGVVLEASDPAEAVLAVAATARLIVVGTQGLWAARPHLGRTPCELLRRAPAAVAVVPAGPLPFAPALTGEAVSRAWRW